MNKVWAELKVSGKAVLALAVVLCGLYPAVVWLAGQGLFPGKANGSLIVKEGAIIGSSLIGQNFAGAQYFHPRPSAAGAGYDGASSGGANLGPLSRKQADEIRRRVTAYREENRLAPDAAVPGDAVMASASGLDPHISVKNALLQARRVTEIRGMGEESILRLIRLSTEGRALGVLGEPRVNVLKLNLALDNLWR